MDEFLSEKEQVERLRQWWRENGWYLLGGAALGLVLLFGWNRYQAYQDRLAEQAADLYQALKLAVDGNSESEAVALLAQLRNDYPDSAYTDQGGLLMARLLLIRSPEQSVDELRYVMQNTEERELGMIARLRLARVLVYRERYDEALALLDVEQPGQFTGRINEIKGDIYALRGQADAARAAYLTAMTSSGAALLDRNFVLMKLNDLADSGAAPSAPMPNEAPADDVEPVEPAEPVEEGA